MENRNEKSIIIECLIGMAALTPATLSDYQTCKWYQQAAEVTVEHHHAFELYLPEKEYLWAIGTTFCESSGRTDAVSVTGARGIWQYVRRSENWLEEKLNEDFDVTSAYDSTYMTSWLLRNDTNPKRHWYESKHCWNKNMPKNSYKLHY